MYDKSTTMPKGAEKLEIIITGGTPHILARTNTKLPMEERHFECFKEDSLISENDGSYYKFVGTAHSSNNYLRYYIFEVLKYK